MQKKQNTRRSHADSIHKIYRAGMFVIAGFIVGFDSEGGNVAQDLVGCIEDTDIPICMVGLLTALANTQLSRRLESENRLYPVDYQVRMFMDAGADQCTLGLNFETRRPRREVLADYKHIVESIYRPTAFFRRVDRVMRQLNCFSPPRTEQPSGRSIAGISLADWRRLWSLIRMTLHVHPLYAPYYVRALYRCARTNPGALAAVASIIAFYLHLEPFSRFVAAAIARQIAELDSGQWRSPLLMPSTYTVEGFLDQWRNSRQRRAPSVRA
jgi:hypothetical protein